MASLATYSLPLFGFYGNVMERMCMRPLSFPCTPSTSHARKKCERIICLSELQYPNSNTEKCFSQLLLASCNRRYFSPLFSTGRRAERHTAGYRDGIFGCYESPTMHKGDKKGEAAKRRTLFLQEICHLVSGHLLPVLTLSLHYTFHQKVMALSAFDCNIKAWRSFSVRKVTYLESWLQLFLF